MTAYQKSQLPKEGGECSALSNSAFALADEFECVPSIPLGEIVSTVKTAIGKTLNFGSPRTSVKEYLPAGYDARPIRDLVNARSATGIINSSGVALTSFAIAQQMLSPSVPNSIRLFCTLAVMCGVFLATNQTLGQFLKKTSGQRRFPASARKELASAQTARKRCAAGLVLASIGMGIMSYVTGPDLVYGISSSIGAAIGTAAGYLMSKVVLRPVKPVEFKTQPENVPAS